MSDRFDDWPDYSEQGMGCGLEDRGITDRYEAMRYGWDQALERVAERIDGYTGPQTAQITPEEAATLKELMEHALAGTQCHLLGRLSEHILYNKLAAIAAATDTGASIMSPEEFEQQYKQEFGPMMCNQKGCESIADWRFTWPGQDEAGICEHHVGKLRGIAAAMGVYVQVIPLAQETGK